MKKLNPKCIYTDQQICLSSTGYFTPCCWFDNPSNRTEIWIRNFFRKDLHIDNNENIEDIFSSKEWQSFWKMLKKNPENAPPTCKRMCSDSVITEKLLENTDDTNIRIRH